MMSELNWSELTYIESDTNSIQKLKLIDCGLDSDIYHIPLFMLSLIVSPLILIVRILILTVRVGGVTNFVRTASLTLVTKLMLIGQD